MARHSDHSREEIHQLALAAAERILEAEGPRGLSARKIATAIGYTVGTLYLVFENLDDLLLQLNGRTLDRLGERLLAAHEGCHDGAECLLALAETYVVFAEAELHRWQLLVERVERVVDDNLPDWYEAKLSLVFGLVEEALARCGGDHDPREAQRAARVLWAGVHGICILKVHQRLDLAGGQSAAGMARMLIETFLRGYGVR